LPQEYRITGMIGEFGPESAKMLDTRAEDDATRGMFWFYGRIIYADVWGTIHTTTFCFASQVWSSWFIPPGCTELNQRT
jgi:hypothetical protein